MYKQTLPHNHRSIGDTIKNMAVTYEDKGTLCKTTHKFTIYTYQIFAFCCLGEFEKAMLNYNEALQIFKQTLPPNHASISDTISRMVDLRLSMQQAA